MSNIISSEPANVLMLGARSTRIYPKNNAHNLHFVVFKGG